MTQESLHRIKRYIQMRDEKPIKHSHDIVNGIHTGTEWEAELRLSDIRNVIHEIEKLRRLVSYLAGTNTDHVRAALAGNPIVCDAIVAEARATLGEKE